MYVQPPESQALQQGVAGGKELPSGLKSIRYLPPSEDTSDAASASSSNPLGVPSFTSYTHGLLASGDQLGTIRLYNLTDLKCIRVMEAHDREVRGMDWHVEEKPAGSTENNTPLNLPLLVSGSRDSMVHLHNLYTPQAPQSVTPQEVHTGAVNAVKLTSLPATDGHPSSLVLISGGSDRQLSIRKDHP